MSDISIIICTMAEASRRTKIERAIDSITVVQDPSAIPIVVANGTKYDPELRQRLESDSRVRYFYLEEASLPKARLFGRHQVDTKYFGFLDDDDEYLPTTLASRMQPMNDNPEIDATVSNGIRTGDGETTPFIRDMDMLRADPAAYLVRNNWLASCGGLFRTDTVGDEYFNGAIKDLEWTYTALRLCLCLTGKIRFIDTPTFAVHTTPNSLSQNASYVFGIPKAIEQLLDLDMPTELRNNFRLKLCDALHNLSNHLLQSGFKKDAWSFHLQSLMHPKALLRYALFTRRLLWDLRK